MFIFSPPVFIHYNDSLCVISIHFGLSLHYVGYLRTECPKKAKGPPKDDPLTDRPTCRATRWDGCRATTWGGTEQPSKAGLLINLPAEQPSKTTTGSRTNTSTGGRAYLVLSYHDDTMRPIISKSCPGRGSNTKGSLSSMTLDTYPCWLVGPVNPIHRDLNIRGSTVTHTLEGTGQYALPGVLLCMMKGDTKGTAEDEVVSKTSLNLTSIWLSRTHQASLLLYQNS